MSFFQRGSQTLYELYKFYTNGEIASNNHWIAAISEMKHGQLLAMLHHNSGDATEKSTLSSKISGGSCQQNITAHLEFG